MGIAMGMFRSGCEVFVDLMFETFVFRCFDVLVNQAAISSLIPFPKKQQGLMIVRLICGPFPGSGPQHGSDGYALLARLPYILVAAVCTGDDISDAYDMAKSKKFPLLLLMSEGVNVKPEKSLSPDSRIHVWGHGKRLGIVCWGIHASIVFKAVEYVGAGENVRIIIPVFLRPLPIDELLKTIAQVDRVMIIDGPSLPTTLGELLVVEVKQQKRHQRVTHYCLWEHGIGALFKPDICIEQLGHGILKLLM